nr:MAG TPA: hypothetical protein [Caudoviricetes sp.]
MMGPCCAVCGETKTIDLYMFNYGMCLCHRCMETAARTFIHDATERKLKENREKVISVEGLPKSEYELRKEFKDKLRKEIEAYIEAKVTMNGENEKPSSKVSGCTDRIQPIPEAI